MCIYYSPLFPLQRRKEPKNQKRVKKTVAPAKVNTSQLIKQQAVATRRSAFPIIRTYTTTASRGTKLHELRMACRLGNTSIDELVFEKKNYSSGMLRAHIGRTRNQATPHAPSIRPSAQTPVAVAVAALAEADRPGRPQPAGGAGGVWPESRCQPRLGLRPACPSRTEAFL